MTHYLLYKTTCQITGKYYCGMHETDRVEDGYLGSGKRLLASIAKYGKENFTREILSYHETKEDLYAAEADLITESMLKDPMCMNLVPGGKGGSGPGKLGASKGGKAFAERLRSDPEFRERVLSQWKNNPNRGGRGFKIRNGHLYAWSQEARAKRAATREASRFQKGSKNSQHGSTCVFNPETKTTKRVPKEELSVWLSQGWVQGSNLGTCFVHHEDHPKAKLIQKEDLPVWLEQGWKQGMKPR